MKSQSQGESPRQFRTRHGPALGRNRDFHYPTPNKR
jgi:hypothetical protein